VNQILILTARRSALQTENSGYFMPEKVSVPEYLSLRQETFDTNPNPAVKADYRSGSGCRGVMTRTWEKCTAE